MKTKEKLLITAHERLTHLKEWLSRTKSAQEKVPDVQDMVERTEWEIQMLSDLPEEGQEFIPLGLIMSYERGNEHLLGNLPLPPKYDDLAVPSIASITTSGSTDMYSILVCVLLSLLCITIFIAVGILSITLISLWTSSFVSRSGSFSL